MRTINDMLSRKDSQLRHFTMWINHQIAQIPTGAPSRVIDVQHTPTLHLSSDGQVWECQHASVFKDVIEHYDHYQDAATGMPQGTSYEAVDACDSCPAYYSYVAEEWVL